MGRRSWTGARWEAGTSLGFLWELVGWWQTGFAWRPEAAINRFAHNRATVDGVRLHFVYERGRGPGRLASVRHRLRRRSCPSGRRRSIPDRSRTASSPLSESESGMGSDCGPGEGLVVAGQGGEVAWEHLLVDAEEASGLPARWRTERH